MVEKNLFQRMKDYKSVAIIIDIVDHVFSDRVWAMASHVAMSSLFALFPFLICLTSIVGLFNLAIDLDSIAELLFQNWPEQAAAPILNEVQTLFTEPKTNLFTLGIVLAIWFASNGIEALRAALNQAYNDDMNESRSFFYRRLQSLFLVVLGVLGSLIFSVLIILGPLIWSITTNFFPFIQEFSNIFDIARYSVTVIVLVVCLMVCHMILPFGNRSIYELVPGIGLTLIFWMIGGIVLGYYLENFSNYASTYAGLAGIMSAIIFLYLISFVFILGGEINAAIIRYRQMKI